ncbi:hypothetical protein OPQ81_007417 [Rhizoctonia solani]|nr:hypothetical protein OPQ81_007417 [Rhizoctonia solani]
MVCQKCTKKLSKVAAPDPFAPSSSSRKVGENKLLTGRNVGGAGSSKRMGLNTVMAVPIRKGYVLSVGNRFSIPKDMSCRANRGCGYRVSVSHDFYSRPTSETH